MLEKFFKTPYQNIFIVRVLNFLQSKPKVKPFHITLCALAFGLFGSFLIAIGAHSSAIAMILFSVYLDSLDGPLARRTQRVSDVGCVLDIISDRIVECAILIGFFFRMGPSSALLVISMLSAILICITSFLIVSMFLGQEGEKSFTYSPGIIERAEAFVFFCVMIVFETHFYLIGWVFTALVILTSVIRLSEFFVNHRKACK